MTLSILNNKRSIRAEDFYSTDIFLRFIGKGAKPFGAWLNIILGIRKMPLTIFISSTLRKYVPGYEPMKGLELSVNGRITIEMLCDRINLPKDEIKMVMVNGKRQDLNYELMGDERVSFFPPVGGG